MSLHHIAQHLKDQGRGPDDMLVHMTRGEVKALQGLAEAHGGSLTTNPQTGLPEAGFLSSILPMAVGALAVATGQLEFLPLIAAGVGVADYALTGSLTQGLMAGLGTWSGGTLAGGLEAAGAQGLVQSGGDIGTEAFNTSQAEIAKQFPTATTESVNQVAAQQALTPQNFPNLSAEQLSSMQGSVLNSANPTDIVKAAGQGSASLGSNVVNPTFSENLSNMGSGLNNIGSVVQANPGAALGAALPLATSSGLLGSLTGTKKGPISGVTQQTSSNPFGLKTIPRDSNGNPIFNASEPTPPNPAYKTTYPNYVANPYNAYGAAAGGVMKMAEGGSAPLIGTPAQNSTMDSTMGNNSTFPMSDMARSYYATPTNLPTGITSQNNNNPATNTAGQIPGYGPRLDTNTGQMMNNFADGGMAGLPYMQQQQNQPATSNGYTPAGGGSTYGQGQFSPQTNPMQPTGLQQMNQMGMPPAQFADGGIARYAGNYASMVSGLQDIKEGADIATRRPVMETPRTDPGIYEDESDIRGLDSYNRTLALLKKNLTASHVKPSKGLPKSAALGAIDLTPTTQAAAEQQAKASIAKEESPSEAKEGGLMAMAVGGNTNLQPTINNPNNSSLFNALGVDPITGQAVQGATYRPTMDASTGLNVPQLAQAFLAAGQTAGKGPYQDFSVNPFNAQQAAQSYNPQSIPTPTSVSMPQQAAGISGYPIDPLKMVGSPAYQAEQARIAAEKAAADAAAQQQSGFFSGMPFMGGFDGGASGGLPKDFKHYAVGGPVDGHLGSYSDGGRLLRGPGDGVSDSIPATIGGKQPARLAEGEFVIPARIVSELGNGSTDAGAKRLYAMMDRIKAKRSKSKNIAADTKAYKYLPA